MTDAQRLAEIEALLPSLTELLVRLADVHPDDLPPSLRDRRAAWTKAGGHWRDPEILLDRVRALEQERDHARAATALLDSVGAGALTDAHEARDAALAERDRLRELLRQALPYLTDKRRHGVESASCECCALARDVDVALRETE